MTTPPEVPPAPEPGTPDPATATAAAVAGLAREVDGLRRLVDPLRELPGRVQDLSRLLAQLTDAIHAQPARAGTQPAPSWLLAPETESAIGELLDELCAWLRAVYLRYRDGATGLPDCWLYHPDVVEELVWLMHAWLTAYQGRTASTALAADWHDRQRPGVVRRIKGYAGSCSLVNHTIRPGWSNAVSAAVPVPGLDGLASITAWWAARRDEPAPEPTVQPVPTSPNGGHQP